MKVPIFMSLLLFLGIVCTYSQSPNKKFYHIVLLQFVLVINLLCRKKITRFWKERPTSTMKRATLRGLNTRPQSMKQVGISLK